jgi:ABC-2 type transport system ATP-binding protein
VRSPQLEQLRSVLLRKDLHVRDDGDGLIVSGMDSAELGTLAAAEGVVLHELSPQRGSLEEAFFHLTGDSVEYRTEDAPELVTAGR